MIISSMRLLIIIAVTLPMILAGGLASAEVFMYTDAKGNILLTDTPRDDMKLASISNKRRIYKPSEFDKKKIQAIKKTKKFRVFTRYSKEIKAACKKYNLDPKLIRALIQVESNFNPKAKSKAGAVGLMQLMPSTAKQLGVKDRLNPADNIEGGVRYLRYLIERFDGNITYAIAAYNCGPLNVEKYGKIPPFKETRRYVKKIYSIYKGRKSMTLKEHGGTIVTRTKMADGSLVYKNNTKGR